MQPLRSCRASSYQGFGLAMIQCVLIKRKMEVFIRVIYLPYSNDSKMFSPHLKMSKYLLSYSSSFDPGRSRKFNLLQSGNIIFAWEPWKQSPFLKDARTSIHIRDKFSITFQSQTLFNSLSCEL